MPKLWIVSVVAVLGAASAVFACGEEENLVITRADGGADGATDGGGTGTLTCGVAIPTTYDSPSFAANAAGELVLRQAIVALDAKMRSAENATPAAVTTADLAGIYAGGAPSLRSVASAFGQATVDQYLTQFGDFDTRVWSATDPDTDGGTTMGGKYETATVVSPSGLSLRDATHSVVLASSLYNYGLGLAAGPISGSTIDRLLAVYGASPSFTALGPVAMTDAGDAGGDPDVLVAAYAAQRDDKVSTTGGPYRRIRSALLVAKAAATDPDRCRTDLDGALKFFFLEWEKVTYLTVIYLLNQAATDALLTPPTPAKNAAALQAYGAAVGLASSFKGIPQDKRTITDDQVDKLLDRVGATTAYQLITQASVRAVAFNTAFQDIGAVYGLTQTEIEDAKKAY